MNIYKTLLNIFIISCLLIFPILDLNFASEYIFVCENMSLKKWLILKAIFMFVNVFFILLFMYSRIKRHYYYLILLINIITLILLIFGTFIFLKNCFNIESKIFICFSIISGYFYVLITILCVMIYYNNYNRLDYPLFTDYDIL